MDRRRSKRWPRQLEVRFWKRGEEDQATRATSINISRTGIFVRTNVVLPSNTRLTLEVKHAGHGFLAEGMVMRALRTPTHLQAVMPSGMGVRFMTPEELIEELLPGVNLRVDEQVQTEISSPSSSGTAGSGAATTAASSFAPTPPPMHAAAAAAAAAVPPTGGGAFRIGTPVSVTGAAPNHPPSTPSPPSSPAPAPAVPPPRPQPPVQAPIFVPLRFRDLAQFSRVFERDVKTGGLFISTDRPAAIDAVIEVEVSIEGSTKPPVRVRARVVHRMEPQPGAPGNLLAGMGVQFVDVPRTIEQLRIFLAP